MGNGFLSCNMDSINPSDAYFKIGMFNLLLAQDHFGRFPVFDPDGLAYLPLSYTEM